MHAKPGQIAAVLGLSNGHSIALLELAARVEQGLPYSCLPELVRAFGDHEQAVVDAIGSRSTLRRRQQRGTFSTGESERLVRLASTWILARDIFGDEQKALRFVHSPHPILGGQRPIDLAASTMFGAEAVAQLLGRLQYGSAA